MIGVGTTPAKNIFVGVFETLVKTPIIFPAFLKALATFPTSAIATFWKNTGTNAEKAFFGIFCLFTSVFETLEQTIFLVVIRVIYAIKDALTICT